MLLQADNSLRQADPEWNFSKDSLSVSVTGGEPEVFPYKAGKGVLTLTKVSGSSPCDVGTIASVDYKMTGDQLLLSSKACSCDAYAKAFTGKPFTKMK